VLIVVGDFEWKCLVERSAEGEFQYKYVSEIGCKVIRFECLHQRFADCAAV
jgi:hypothetical protein